jgi:putative methyltransferase
MAASFGTVRNEALLYVLLYELLLGPNQKIRGGGALKRKIMAKEGELRQILQGLQNEDGTHGSSTATSVTFPRYVRVNKVKQDTVETVTLLRQEADQIFADPHVPDLLVLRPSVTLHDHSLVTEGRVVLQDKSSCFSALCLIHGNEIPLNGDILDACSAPGNKTSHLAALLHDIGSDEKRKVYALDRSSERLALLTRRLDHLGFTRKDQRVEVAPKHADFLKTDPTQFPSVRGILLDPSCSGSGIYTSPDRQWESHHDEKETSSRLQSLANFQCTALQHAMSFNQVERIVYSTCSSHEIENEQVVSQALAKNSNKWKIVAPKCLSHWKRRGRVVNGISEQQARCMIRADREDETNAFFVCCLERLGASSSTILSSPKLKAERNVDTRIPQWTPPKDVPFYNGEFSSKAAILSRRHEQSNDVGSKQTKSKGKPAKKTEKSGTDNGAADKPLSKKRKKKLEWKQRQRDQKLRRIEAKQADKSVKK